MQKSTVIFIGAGVIMLLLIVLVSGTYLRTQLVGTNEMRPVTDLYNSGAVPSGAPADKSDIELAESLEGIENWCGLADTNRDGIVDRADVVAILMSHGRTDCKAENDWCDGADVNRDGGVGIEDVGIVQEKLGETGCEEITGNIYYVSNLGNDEYSGTMDDPWKTISKVNAQSFSPGDSILFKRGDTWREQLIPHSGDSTGHITYGDYGIGDKPKLLGSIEMNNPSDWVDEGGNIWATKSLTSIINIGSELLSNPSFDTDTNRWSLYEESGADVTGSRDTIEFDSSPASYKIESIAPGSRASHVQFYTTRLSIEDNKCYRLKFSAKANQEVALSQIKLMRATNPWGIYSSQQLGDSPTITTEWKDYAVLYESAVTVTDGRINFRLGDSLPAGAILTLDSLSFKECDKGSFFDLPVDVGNLIFNNEESVGVKVWEETDLNQQGEFWYDEDNWQLKIYSASNPANYYSDIEAALRRDIIFESDRSYVIYENLDLRYGAARGIGGINNHHIIIRDNDFSYIGGGDQYGGDRTVRYGNSISFWQEAHDNIVERNRFDNIYDAALTNQGTGPSTQENITYRNNIITNSEYCFEYWNRPATSITNNINFYNNICAYSGQGWGHNQRPNNKNGRHLMFYANSAQTSNFNIRNNIFYESTESAIRVYDAMWNGLDTMVLENNLYYESSGDLADWQGVSYSYDNFDIWRADTGKGSNSINADPLFINPAEGDFHLQPASPAINTGIDVGINFDFDGNPIPNNGVPDMGAYEF